MRFQRRTTRLLSGAGLGALLGGCHEYVPVRDGTSLPQNITVRASLTDAGTVAVAPIFGPHVRMVEGALVSRADTALVMRVTQVTRADGTEQTLGGDQVVLVGSSVQDVGYVRLAVGRSIALAAAIVAGAVAVGVSGLGGSGAPVAGRGVGPPGSPK
ncbi:MAG TPA: hypothetical protein VGD56_05505 [Gemmatirosa sp.]